MPPLQKPKYVYQRGSLRPWDQAQLHVGCEAVTRNVNVFEGLKGYWQPDGTFGVVQLKQHYERLRRSARLLHMPWECSYDEYRSSITELAAVLLEPGRDMWFRTTLYAVEGHWGEGTQADLVITAYHQEQKEPEMINLGVSTWRRAADAALPPRVKSGSNYQVARLARIEGRACGCDDMILLNSAGRVAEATGACVLMLRGGVLTTPPATEGALESITLDIVQALAESAGIRFERRPIDRTELIIADEIALCGTLSELVRARRIEGLPLNAEPSTMRLLQARYLRAVRNIEPHAAVALTTIAQRRSPSLLLSAPSN